MPCARTCNAIRSISAASRVATLPMWLFSPTTPGTAAMAPRRRARFSSAGRSTRSGSGPVCRMLSVCACIGMCSSASCPRAAAARICAVRSAAKGNQASVSGPGSASACAVRACITPMSSMTTAIFGRLSAMSTATAWRRQVGGAEAAGPRGGGVVGPGGGDGDTDCAATPRGTAADTLSRPARTARREGCMRVSL